MTQTTPPGPSEAHALPRAAQPAGPTLGTRVRNLRSRIRVRLGLIRRHPRAQLSGLVGIALYRGTIGFGIRTRLGLVDIHEVRDALAHMPVEPLDTWAWCARGLPLDEFGEPANSFALALEEIGQRVFSAEDPDQLAIPYHWYQQGDFKTYAWARLQLDLTRDRPATALGRDSLPPVEPPTDADHPDRPARGACA